MHIGFCSDICPEWRCRTTFPPNPGPVRRCPEAIARLGKKVVRHLHSGQMSEQNPMCMQSALGWTGRSGGIDDQGGVLGCSVHCVEAVRGLGKQAIEIDRFVLSATSHNNGS